MAFVAWGKNKEKGKPKPALNNITVLVLNTASLNN